MRFLTSSVYKASPDPCPANTCRQSVLSLQSLNGLFVKAAVFDFDEVLLVCSFTDDAFGIKENLTHSHIHTHKRQFYFLSNVGVFVVVVVLFFYFIIFFFPASTGYTLQDRVEWSVKNG